LPEQHRGPAGGGRLHLAVDAEVSGGTLRLCVRDDGVGGADPVRGSGLVGQPDAAPEE